MKVAMSHRKSWIAHSYMKNNCKYEGRNNIETKRAKSYKKKMKTISSLLTLRYGPIYITYRARSWWQLYVSVYISYSMNLKSEYLFVIMIRRCTFECLPWIYDTIIVNVKEGCMLLKDRHVIMLVTPGAIHILCIRGNQGSWHI